MSSSPKPGVPAVPPANSPKPGVPAVPPAKSPPAFLTPSGNLPVLRGRGFKRSGLIGANFGSAVEALWANRMRSLLTALGIFIGVAAVISLLTLTQGVGAFLNNSIASVGTNTIFIRNGSASKRGARGAGGEVQSLTADDANAIRQVPHVLAVSPVVSTGGQVVYGNQNWSTSVQGVSTDYQTIESWDMAEGIWFSSTDVQAGKPVAIIGQTVKQNLFDPTGTDPLNKTIRIGNQLFQVVGVLQTKGSSGFGNSDDIIFIPYTAALDRLKNSNFVDAILIAADDPTNVDQAQQDITTLLEQRHHILKGQSDDFQTGSANQVLQIANQFTLIITFLFVGIASISLTVGGIGIMNIMLVSITERTREIGIRMSIGARRSDIRNQFLIEALSLSLLGGIIGMLLGLLIGFGLTKAASNLLGAQLPFVISPFSIIVPFAVSAAIGIVFGLYPAIRASHLDPIDALRAD